MSARRRQALARALVVAAGVVAMVAVLAGYARTSVVNSDQFANRATAALRNDSVRSLAAQRITDEVVLKHQADLVAARPLIESTVSTVVGSRAFTELFRQGVRDAYRTVIDRDRNTLTLTVGDVGTVVQSVLQKVRPKLARTVGATGKIELLDRDLGSEGGQLARTAAKVRALAVILLVAVVLLAAGALVVAPDRRRTVVDLGMAAAVCGVLLVVAYSVARSYVVGQVDGADNQAAARGVWDAFMADLRTIAWILAGSGAVVAAAAASLIRPVDVRGPIRRVAGVITTEPERPLLRVVRGLGIAGVGLLVVFDTDAVVALVLTVAGVYLIYDGLTAVLRVIYHPPAASADQPRPARPARWRRVAVPAVAVLLVAGAAGALFGSGATTVAAPADGACNGHRELCSKSLDQIALPATHNSMAVPLPGWFASEQDRPIPDQLNDGIRGLLLDTHYADRVSGGRLRTEFGSGSKVTKEVERSELSPQTIAAAERIRERLGFRGKGTRGMYLCHTFCEVGATPLRTVLDQIHDFLVANPDEVVVVVNEDYVRPAEFVKAVDTAGLADMMFTPPRRGRWPTLRSMIDSGRRLVILAENQGGGAAWYQPAFKRIVQDTPYTFNKTSQLTDRAQLPKSCQRNRGPDGGAPFLLVNHWISTDPLPRPSDAATVNARGPLLRRARACEKARGHLPTLVAVNFYRRGDVFGVVDALNGVK